MPPMPGQSRSLLQFDGLDRSNNDIADLKDFQETIETEGEKTMMIKLEKGGAEPPYSDHDYTYTYKYTDGVKAESGSAWIEEDAPPMVSCNKVQMCEDVLSWNPRGPEGLSCGPTAATLLRAWHLTTFYCTQNFLLGTLGTSACIGHLAPCTDIHNSHMKRLSFS